MGGELSPSSLKMRVKGSITKKWSKEQKERAENTINKMIENRKEDELMLRQKMEEKISQLEIQKKNLIELGEKLKDQTNQINKQLLKILGAEYILKEILNPPEKNDVNS